MDLSFDELSLALSYVCACPSSSGAASTLPPPPPTTAATKAPKKAAADDNCDDMFGDDEDMFADVCTLKKIDYVFCSFHNQKVM